MVGVISYVAGSRCVDLRIGTTPKGNIQNSRISIAKLLYLLPSACQTTIMRLFFTLTGLLFCIGFFACKSTKKLFDEGQYERAYFSAIDDLKKNASNTSALQILPDAYQQASRQLIGSVRSA